MSDELLLRSSVNIAYAIQALSRLLTRGHEVPQAGGEFERLLNGYLMWVEDAEACLRSLFVSPTIWRDLYTDRYWRIRAMHAGRVVRPFPLITSEASWQLERLDAVVQHLRDTHQRFELPHDCLAIAPDTNVFAHFRRYDEIPWDRLVQSKGARLVIPLLVIDELDELSYRSRPRADTASGVIRALQRSRGSAAPEAPVEIRPGVTLQLLVDPPRHTRRTNNDDEFLTRVEYLSRLVGSRVVVATGDYGMRLRAQARGLHYLELPDEFRL